MGVSGLSDMDNEFYLAFQPFTHYKMFFVVVVVFAETGNKSSDQHKNLFCLDTFLYYFIVLVLLGIVFSMLI